MIDPALTSKLIQYFDTSLCKEVSYYNAFNFGIIIDKIAETELAVLSNFVPDIVTVNADYILVINNSNKDFAIFYAPKSFNAINELISQYKSVYLFCPVFDLNINKPFQLAKTYHQIIVDNIMFCKSSEQSWEWNFANYLNKRATQVYKKNDRECQMISLNPESISDTSTIIKHWSSKSASLGKNLKPINKDIKHLKYYFDNTDQKFGYIVYRGKLPVGFAIFVKINHESCSLLSFKALNYKNQPGGYNGTSFWFMSKCFNRLYKQGMLRTNLSSSNIDGGNYRFKQKFLFAGKEIKAHDYIITSE